MEYLFFIAAGIVVYVYFLFPAAMLLLSYLPARRASRRLDLPAVTVLTAARNERAVIRAKVENTFASDYPHEKLDMIVGSDGSTDGTDEEVERLARPRLRLVRTPGHVGKANAINAIAADATGEILVFSDADILLAPDAIRELLALFDDPSVGAVCGKRTDNARQLTAAGYAARLYNLYEGRIKRGEGRLGRIMGGDGSLYAVRRALFRPLPADVPDDFVNILRVLAAGYRVRYAPRAVSWEELPREGGMEFVRRRRVVARCMAALCEVRELLNPLRFPITSFLLLSHRLLRWTTGLLLFILMSGTIWLARDSRFFQWLLLLQALFYLFAIAGKYVAHGPFMKPFRIARHFVFSNAAATLGICDFLRGRTWRTWDAQRE